MPSSTSPCSAAAKFVHPPGPPPGAWPIRSLKPWRFPAWRAMTGHQRSAGAQTQTFPLRRSNRTRALWASQWPGPPRFVPLQTLPIPSLNSFSPRPPHTFVPACDLPLTCNTYCSNVLVLNLPCHSLFLIKQTTLVFAPTLSDQTPRNRNIEPVYFQLASPFNLRPVL
jgi:hypothetical protein